jgi:hypothetical protein
MFSCFNGVNLSPELRLMLACLRALPNEKEVQQIKKLSDTKIAWHDFRMLVGRHRVAPLVFTNLNRYAREAIPPAIMRSLRSRFERNAYRSIANTSELVRLYRLFQENGIPVLPLKGSLLALQVYGNLALRHAGDIDLLIDPRHIELADRLIRKDYRKTLPAFRLTPSQHQRFLRLMHHFKYLNDQKNLYIELHWRPFHKQSPHVMDLTRLRSRASTVTVAGSTLPALSVLDNIIYLCGHGWHHFWHRIFWLVDLAEIIRGNPEIDWQRLMTLARGSGMMRPLAQGFSLAHELLEVPLPEAIRSYALQDQQVSNSAKVAYRYMLYPQPEKPPVSLSLRYLACNISFANSFSEKLYVLQHFCLGNDWLTVPLSESQFYLYYVLRFPFWLHRRLGSSRNPTDHFKP